MSPLTNDRDKLERIYLFKAFNAPIVVTKGHYY